MSNIVFIEFYNKSGFPPGEWMKEPDFCQWTKHGLTCLARRDMSLGMWRGFVGVEPSHPFYEFSIDDMMKNEKALEIFFMSYGGISCVGNFFADNSKTWWFGIETSHGADLMPLVKFDEAALKMSGKQTYKNLSFIRRETNKLAKHLSQVK